MFLPQCANKMIIRECSYWTISTPDCLCASCGEERRPGLPTRFASTAISSTLNSSNGCAIADLTKINVHECVCSGS